MNQYLDLNDVLKVVEVYEDKYSIYYGYKGAVLNALAQGYSVSVYDGEEWSLERSKSFKHIIEEIEGVEDCSLAFWHKENLLEQLEVYEGDEGHYEIGGAYIIPFLNGYEDSVSDFHNNKFMDKIFRNPNYKED